MKKLVSIAAIAVALSLLGVAASRGQDDAEKARADAQQTQADARRLQAQTQKQMEALAARQASQVPVTSRQLAQASVSTGGSASSTGGSTSSGGPVRPFTDRLQTVIRRAPGAATKTLVIRSADIDAKAQASLEEDMAVMSRIFDKALDEKLGGQPNASTAMGISVVFSPGASPIRSLYLEGYGALFMLDVGFSLVSPPAKTEVQKEEAPTDSTWEAAKRELYGPRNPTKPAAAPAEEYSEEKVNKLKDALLEALKNAANIRDLKPDDSVTVCVFGGAGVATAGGRTSSSVRIVPMEDSVAVPATATSVYADNRTRQYIYTTSGNSGAPARGTILTLRVKKADVDAFAKGKLNADEFRKKAAITTYAGNAVGGGGFPSATSGSTATFSTP